MFEINVIVLTKAVVRVLVVDYIFAFRLPLLAGVALYYSLTTLIQSVAISVRYLPTFTLATNDDPSIVLRLTPPPQSSTRLSLRRWWTGR